jgi:hypothetical protein
MQTNVDCAREQCPLDYGDDYKNGAVEGKVTTCALCSRRFRWRESTVINEDQDERTGLIGDEVK